MDDPVLTAHELVRDRFPGARAAFLAGSVLTDRRTPTSDLDIVALGRAARTQPGEPGVPRMAGGAIRADAGRLAPFRRSGDREAEFTAARHVFRRHAPGRHGWARRFAPGRARKRWAAGPPPLSDRERDYQRYILTDLLDDLRGCADPAERVHLVAHMLQRASQLVLLVGGHWLGGGKWLSRRLAAADPGLHRALTGGAAQAFTGDTSVFAAAVTEVLDRAGGPLWDGYAVR